MGISEDVKIKRTIKCDNEASCKTEIVYNPQPGPTEQLPTKLNDVVFIKHAMSGWETIYCTPECAIIALNDNKHLKPAAPSVQLAGEAEANAVVRDAEATKKLRLVQ